MIEFFGLAKEARLKPAAHESLVEGERVGSVDSENPESSTRCAAVSKKGAPSHKAEAILGGQGNRLWTRRTRYAFEATDSLNKLASFASRIQSQLRPPEDTRF